MRFEQTTDEAGRRAPLVYSIEARATEGDADSDVMRMVEQFGGDHDGRTQFIAVLDTYKVAAARLEDIYRRAGRFARVEIREKIQEAHDAHLDMSQFEKGA